METGNGRESILVTPSRNLIVRNLAGKGLILLALFMLSSVSDLRALPRRTQEAADWGDPEKLSPLPSVQSHRGPLIFSTFTRNDLNQAEVRSEIEKQLRNDSLLAQQNSRIRGELYRDFITARLHEHRLPGDLLTIAYIESAFNIRAESRTGARGLWQFADNSMEPWLKASASSPSWDERFDFWKSTGAAMEKLLQNHARTGDWLLAVGAYNGGLGRMTRAMARGGDSFWELERGQRTDQISQETARYVPKFIAASIVSLYPGRFGIKLGWSGAYNWKRIAYEGSLNDFAEKTGIPLMTIEAGNAEYLEGIVPRGNHHVKFPARYAGAVLENISKEFPGSIHLVQTGDTLWNISRRYDLSIHELRDMNSIGVDDILRPGMRLIVKSVLPGAASSDNN